MDIGDLPSELYSDMRKKLKLDGSVDDDDLLYKAIAMWFIDYEVNPNTIKTPSFTKFMSCLNPKFPPRVTKVEQEILEIYEKYKEKAKKFLKDFEGQLTLSYERFLLGCKWTRDYVKGPILHDDFVCLTAHFIDDNWKIKKWILGYTTDKNVPSEDLYVYHFRNAIHNFEIENKVSTLLLPNNQGFDEETLDPLKKWIEEKRNHQINPEVLLVYCCADLFRLMVNDLYSELSSSLVEDVRVLVGWGKCLSNNWNIMLSNLQRAVDMKSKDKFSKNETSDEDWLKIQTFCKLAGCIYKVTTKLFERECPTSNVYFHLLSELKVLLNQELASGDNEYFICKAKKILTRFDKYWNNMFLVLATASVLDPRFKMKYLKFYCSKKEVNVEDSKAETVLDYLSNLYASCVASDIYQKSICLVATINSKEEEDDDDDDDYDDDYDEDEDEDDDEDEEDDDYDDEDEEEESGAENDKEEESDAYKEFVLFQEFLRSDESPREEINETELDLYLKEPVMEWNKDFKALEWWKEESQKYPTLARVARDVLSIPISRAKPYDAYVLDNREPPEFVLSMKPKLTNTMMCSKKWLRL